MSLSRHSYQTFLWQYLQPQRGKVLLLAVLLLAGISLQLTSPQVISTFIDGIAGGQPLATLVRLALLLLGVTLLLALVKLAQTYLSEAVGWTATNQLRADLTSHCLQLDMTFHNTHTPGELIERVDGDVGQLAHFFAKLVLEILSNLLLMIGILLVLWWENWQLGLAYTLFAGLTFLSMARMRDFATEQLRAERAASATLFGFVEERLGATEDLRANGAVAYTLRRLFVVMRELWHKGRQAALRSALFGSGVVVWFEAGAALALALGAYLFLQGTLSLGTVFLLYAYVLMLQEPLMLLTQEMQHLQEASGSLLRIAELFQVERTILNGRLSLPPGPLAVEFAAVTFAYDLPSSESSAASPRPAPLANFTYQLASGRTVGLLGRTGSGKTTLARLLLRLYDPQQGTIRLNGVDLRDLQLADLRRSIGMVTQDVQIFQATVRDNLTLFDPMITDEQIRAVLQDLGLGDWLANLHQGLETQLATGGGGLSAGQAQLLAFGRVFLRDPGLVILDEATSRLDPATERLLEQAVGRLLRNRTAIVIAHRLTTVQQVDEILILDHGCIAEVGPRPQLAADPTSHFTRLLQRGLEAGINHQ